jgi:hypothetical protein
MRNAILSIAFVLMLVSPAAAQVKPEFDPDLAWNTLRAEYGALIPAGTVSNRNFGLLSLSYTRRYSGRWGWRTGVQYAQLDAPIDHYVGIPLAAVYRFRTESFDGRVKRAMDKSLDDLSWDYGGDPPDYEKQRMRSSVVLNLFNIFLRRSELFAGITPGYLFGEGTRNPSIYGMTTSAGPIWMETGYQVNNRFSLSVDAGATLSIPLWRFSLDITPAAHYLITKNISENRQSIDFKNNTPIGHPTVKPIRWLFSISGGLSFLF